VDILIVRLDLAGKDALMGAKKKSYTPKYRQEAAHLVIDTGRTIAEVAREIGVGEQLLGRWVAIERSRMDDPPEAIDADERAELERLRRENAELRMDREFLKKATAFFVTETSNPSGRSR
jgi:transposase